MPWKLSKRSTAALAGVHKDLVAVVKRSLLTSRHDFVVLDGIRSPKEQAELVKRGASKIHDSRHLYGLAVDLGVLINGEISWHWPDYIALAADVKRAAAELHIPLAWGGDWPHFKDGGHFELPRDDYPNPA